MYTPAELHAWGTAHVEAGDRHGAEADDRPPAQVNELRLFRRRSGGGKVSARFDDAAMFDAIATVIDAGAKPRGADDVRRLHSARPRRWRTPVGTSSIMRRRTFFPTLRVTALT